MRGNKTILRILLTVAFFAMAFSVFAQSSNSGEKPFIGSTHKYSVSIGDVADSISWEILRRHANEVDSVVALIGIKDFGANEGHVLKNISQDEISCYLDLTGSTEKYSILNVTFTRNIELKVDEYNDAGIKTSSSVNTNFFKFPSNNYYLRYREFDVTNNCLSTRVLQLDLMESNFYTILYDEDNDFDSGGLPAYEECHDSTGTVQTHASAQNANALTTVEVPIYLHSDGSFEIDSVAFEFDINLVSSSASSIPSWQVINGDYINAPGTYPQLHKRSTMASSTTLKMVVDCSHLTNEIENMMVEIGVDVKGKMIDDHEFALTVTKAIAYSGEDGAIITVDNVDLYPDDDSDPYNVPNGFDIDSTPGLNEWRTRSYKVLGLPHTSDITVTL